MKIIDEIETQRKQQTNKQTNKQTSSTNKQTQKRTKGKEGIVNGQKLNDFVVHLSQVLPN